MSAQDVHGSEARKAARSLEAWSSTTDAEQDSERGPAPWRAHAAEVLAARPAIPDQSDLLAPLPPELCAHVEQLRASADGQKMFDEGWQPMLVTDLRRVIAAQRNVLEDSAYTASAVPSDLASLVGVTLPIKRPDAEIPVQFDAGRQVWTVTSPNPNLRITGRFGGKLSHGQLGFGFVVEVLASFVSVATYQGRLVLRDGYHRAHWLLSAGIVAVPAFVREFGDDERVFNREMLPENVWMGEHPPMLADFSDDALSRAVLIPDIDTTLYVSAMPTRLALDTQAA